MTDSNRRIEWLDSLRAIAILAVIVIHVSSPVVNRAYGSNMTYWWIGHVFDSAVRFAVPLFLMISGAMLLTKEYNLREFYKKRVVRVLLPFPFYNGAAKYVKSVFLCQFRKYARYFSRYCIIHYSLL